MYLLGRGEEEINLKFNIFSFFVVQQWINTIPTFYSKSPWLYTQLFFLSQASLCKTYFVPLF